MKITDVEAIILRQPTMDVSKADGSQDALLIRVHTDAGITGVGEVDSLPPVIKAIVEAPPSHAIASGLRHLLIGENPLETDRLWHKLYRGSIYYGRQGPAIHAISGIDIALWDILGKVTGMPVGRLLGGTYRKRVQPYCSLLMDQPGPMHDLIAEYRDRGFRAFKIGWGPFGRVDARTDEAIVKAARTAVGDDALLMVDAGGSDAFWRGDYKWALKTSYMLAGYRVAWFEEPLVPDALEDHVALRRNAPLPISGGEVLTRRQSFEPYLRAGAFDIVQPDVTKVGGMSEERRIAWTAQENGVRMIPHGWNTAVGLAADLQLASALPGTDLVEYKTGSPYIDEVAAGGWSLDEDGMLPIPDTPGLGLELDPDALAKYAQGEQALYG